MEVPEISVVFASFTRAHAHNMTKWKKQKKAAGNPETNNGNQKQQNSFAKKKRQDPEQEDDDLIDVQEDEDEEDQEEEIKETPSKIENGVETFTGPDEEDDEKDQKKKKKSGGFQSMSKSIFCINFSNVWHLGEHCSFSQFLFSLTIINFFA